MEKSVNLNDIYKELKRIEASMITKKEMEEILETISIVSNEDTMEQINASETDIEKRQVTVIDSVHDL